ncbi:uncharacterized protein PHACADRAFT_27601 [Phanerochaete carnosa HHB-10118-sp]|uniref:Uncharacterized protein n=1 Tax=Phanerochaete carnosa (strain HHB-10118-sp) TaxID=650164 RepID=K5X241_PHACS|nr:uncharacterized protein PHACADRAFT_27601 [Phanerochaete carnosa HHB-10118-sp]EKM56827.1 hypothetical protein PHACADRAFT_27601 [Phanerochaete carnosa HHB-10118-sp]
MSINGTGDRYATEWEVFEVPMLGSSSQGVPVENAHRNAGMASATDVSNLSLISLFDVVWSVRGQIETFRECVEKLFDVVGTLSSRMNVVIEATIGTKKSSRALKSHKPLYRENFLGMHFWHKSIWKESKDVQPSQSNSKEDKKNWSKSQAEYKNLGFFKWESGQVFLIGERAAVANVARCTFRELDHSKVMAPPATWMGLALDYHREIVFSALYNNYPVIANCTDDWKADQHHSWPKRWAAQMPTARSIKKEARSVSIVAEEDRVNPMPEIEVDKGEPNVGHDENTDPAPLLPGSMQK